MKKLYTLVLFLVITLVLVSCGNTNSLIITTYLEGIGSNQCIEIYNNSDKVVNLKNYSINIYNNSGGVKRSVELSGKLAANDCYVVVNEKADAELLSKADLASADLVFGGIEGIAICYKDKVIDAFGNVGLRNNNKDITYLRKMEHRNPNPICDYYDYIIYDVNYTKYLGVYETSVTEEELLEGPKFDPEYLKRDFVLKSDTPTKMGGGGAVEVSLYRNVDGDTTYFIFPDELDIASFVNPDNIIWTNGKPSTKVRYQDINTPETFAGGIEEWGWPAKLYTADVQTKADKIYIQSVLGDSLLCTYGRILGYVFVQNGDDSVCVNFMLIKQGYSTISVNTLQDLKYKDVTYYGYFQNAMYYAERNYLGLHGDMLDPHWDYHKNQSKYA
jgi:endonuclease YncB( thermonuclease family)